MSYAIAFARGGFFGLGVKTAAATVLTAALTADGIVRSVGIGAQADNVQIGDLCNVAGSAAGNDGDYPILAVIDDNTIWVDNVFAPEAIGSVLVQIRQTTGTLTIIDETAISFTAAIATPAVAKFIRRRGLAYEPTNNTFTHWFIPVKEINISTTGTAKDCVWTSEREYVLFAGGEIFTENPATIVWTPYLASTLEVNLGANPSGDMERGHSPSVWGNFGMGVTPTPNYDFNIHGGSLVSNDVSTANGFGAIDPNNCTAGVIDGPTRLQQSSGVSNLYTSHPSSQPLVVLASVPTNNIMQGESPVSSVISGSTSPTLEGLRRADGIVPSFDLRFLTTGLYFRILNPQEDYALSDLFITTNAGSGHADPVEGRKAFTFNPRFVEEDQFFGAGEPVTIAGLDVVFYQQDQDRGMRQVGTSATDGTYTVEINGTPASYVAVSKTTTQIKAGLIAAINLIAEPVTASGTDTDSQVPFGVAADVAGTQYTIEITSDPTGQWELVGEPSVVATYTTSAAGRVNGDAGIDLDQGIVQRADARGTFNRIFSMHIEGLGYRTLDRPFTMRDKLGQDVDITVPRVDISMAGGLG